MYILMFHYLPVNFLQIAERALRFKPKEARLKKQMDSQNLDYDGFGYVN